MEREKENEKELSKRISFIRAFWLLDTKDFIALLPRLLQSFLLKKSEFDPSREHFSIVLSCEGDPNKNTFSLSTAAIIHGGHLSNCKVIE